MRYVAAVLLTMLSAGSAACVGLGESTLLPVQGEFGRALWSPSGRGLALAGQRYNGLYYVTPSGEARTLSSAPLSGWGFTFSPDGQRIAYRSREDGGRGVALMVAGTDGKPTQITPFMDGNVQARWDNDGLTYKCGDEIVTVDHEGSLKRSISLSQGRGLLARIMNVSSLLVAAHITGAGLTPLQALPKPGPAKAGSATTAVFTDSESQVWTADEKGNMSRLLDIEGVQGYGEPTPSPSDDVYAVPAYDGNLYIADPRGGDPVNLGPGSNPTWSPDGKYVMYVRSTDDGQRVTSSQLWVSSTDGSYQAQLMTAEGAIEWPSWSSDGGQIAYTLNGEIYIAPVEQ